MYIRLTKGKTQKRGTIVYLVEGYREQGKSKQRVIHNFGYLEELELIEPNILERLKQEAKESTLDQYVDVTLNLNTHSNHASKPLNYGFFLLDALYQELHLSDFFDKQSRNYKFTYDIDEVVRLLVYSRILRPASKKETFENKSMYFDAFQTIKLEDLYKSLSVLNDIKENVQLYIHKRIQEIYQRNPILIFYDVTNYYFEIETSDPENEGLRAKGVCKEHRPNPIVQMGLLIDDKGIPIAYRLFRGNTSDTKTMIPILKEIKKQYGFERVIVVADKGLNSASNLYDISADGDGYIVSEKIRGRKPELIQKILDPIGYTFNDHQTFKIKSWLDEKEATMADGTITHLKEKVIVFWSKKHDEREKHKRGPIEELIHKYIETPSLYTASNAYGIKKYLKEMHVDKKTGEVVKKKPKLIFDEEKYKRDVALDGYYMLVTSETKMDNQSVIESYKGLSKIEDAFRIMKSDLEGRPVYVRTEDHIEGHFLICFLSLTLMRILQMKSGYRWSAAKIQKALSEAGVIYLEKGIYTVFKNDDVFDEIAELYDLKIDNKYMKHETIKKLQKELIRNTQQNSK
ncbi:MAG: IS1634 family transposase [Acholeplasmataceae bacterium]|nr:IS1634 family transposase [Acholeplasmataceae bacterium]